MTVPLRVLLVEDSAEDAELEEHELRKAGLDFVLQRAPDLRALEALLAGPEPDLVLSDFSLPDLSGLEVLDRVRGRFPDVPFIFVSGTIGEERAIDALRRGATDYVLKDRPGALPLRVRRALAEREERRARRRLEEDLRHSQKMDALGRMAAGVAHDVRNVLTAVLGLGELLLEKIGPDGPGRREAEEIYRAAEGAASLSQGLLTFSRKAPLAPRIVDLNAVVGTCARLVGGLLGASTTVEVRLDPAAGAVRADPAGLEQILLNLAGNARDAMRDAGTVTIRTGRAVLEEGALPGGYGLAPGAHAYVEIADTGTGIAPEVLPHIFEPFFTTKAADRGTGLGLAAVYGLVKAFGGGIHVASEPGRGSTFRILLPAVETAGTAVETARLPRTAANRESVLLVEDEPAVRQFMRRILETQGYAVLDAADGRGAVRLAEAHPGPIDLMISDWVMPRMTGGELAAEIRRTRPDLAVLLVSGRAPALPPGAAFLAKPFTPVAFARKVREILDGRR